MFLLSDSEHLVICREGNGNEKVIIKGIEQRCFMQKVGKKIFICVFVDAENLVRLH